MSKKYRQIAQDDHTLDATTNAPDEWPSETGIPVPGKWVDGLPPIGTECEFEIVRDEGRWEKIYICGKDSAGDLVFEFLTGDTDSLFDSTPFPARFRPIETPAQAEEREREEAKKQLAGLLQKHDQDVTDLCNRSISYFVPLAEFLLDNGCQLKDKSDD